MVAAARTAQLGARVTVVEKAPRLGGSGYGHGARFDVYDFIARL